MSSAQISKIFAPGTHANTSPGNLSQFTGLLARNTPHLLSAVRVGIGLLLLFSCLSKISQYHSFLSAVYSYEILSPRMGMMAAIIIPWVEFFAGVSLVAGVARAGALLCAALLMAVFVGAQGWALYQGLQISCGCFGVSEPQLVSPYTLGRTLILLALCLGCFAYYLKRDDAEASGNTA